MKKRFLMFLLFLVIPSVYATISFDSLARTEYNYGDEIELSGYIFEEQAITGSLKFTLNCENGEFNLPITMVSLNDGEKKNFPAGLSIPKITISRSMEGDCLVRAALVVNGEEVDSATSGDFSITNELLGEFSIDEARIQAGKSFKLQGEVSKLNGELIDGSAEIYFKGEENRFLVAIANIKDGKLDYTYQSTFMPEGTYYIDVLVNDVFGDQHLFEDVDFFMFITDLYVFVSTESNNAEPGGKIRLSGDVRTIVQESIENANVEITLDDQKYVAKVKNSKFDYVIPVPEDIKSGLHKIVVEVTDDFGNKGIADTGVEIKAIPKELLLQFDKQNYQPGEVIKVTPLLYDQGGDLVRVYVDLSFYNPNKELLLEDNVKVNEEQQYALDVFAVPGLYLYKLEYGSLVSEGTVQIERILKVDVTLENQTLYINNIGNINYKGTIILDFNRGEYEITEKISLKPNTTKEIRLDEEVPSGTYTLVVKYGDEEQEFSNLVVVGKGKRSFNLIYAVFVVVFVALLIYLAYVKKKKSVRRKIRHHTEKERGKEVGHKLRAKRKERKPLRFNFGVATKKDTEEFKKRVLKDIEKAQKKE